MKSRYEGVRNRFLKIYGDTGEGHKVTMVRAPGRAILLGEYTDMHGGCSLGMNVGREIVVAAQRRSDGVVSMYSMDFEEKIQARAGALRYMPEDGWANYPKAVWWAMENAGHKFSGFNIVISGNIPQGAGLASSSALEVAVALATTLLEGGQWDPLAMTRIIQSAQTQFVKSTVSALDPLCIMAAKPGHALFVDAKTLAFENIPAQFEEVMFSAVESGKSRSLHGGEAGQRLEECREALQILKKKNPAYEALCDVRVVPFERYKSSLPPKLRARAEHVIHENDRVMKAKAALIEGDIGTFGELMKRSHRSLARLFQVSSEELDTLVQYAAAQETVYGAKLSGGGLGGCMVQVMEARTAEASLESLKRFYRQKIGLKATVLPCEPVEPACEIEE